MLADNLAGINLDTRLDEETPAVLKLVHRVGHRNTGFERHQRTVSPALDVTLVRLVILEAVSDDSLSLSCSKQVAAESH